MAAFAVVSGISNASNSISTGVNGVSLTLTGILYQEEDRHGLKNVLSALFRCGVVLGLCVGLVLAVFAPVFVGLFLPDPGRTRDMAVLDVRLFSAGLIPCCVLNALKGYFQGSGRVLWTEIISFAEGAFLPCAAVFALRVLFGLNGMWLHFAVGETLALSAVIIFAAFRSRPGTAGMDKLMLLSDDFGVDDSNLMEADIRTLEDVSSVSEAAERFCRDHGQSPLFSTRIALCVEEMASNAVMHGFAPGGKNRLSVRIQHKGTKWILRFRDDCASFDPVSYVPQNNEGPGMGIRLVTAMADEIHYTGSLNLNNLTILLDGTGDLNREQCSPHGDVNAVPSKSKGEDPS